MLLFLVTPCLILTAHPCMEWIPIKKKKMTPLIWLPFLLRSMTLTVLRYWFIYFVWFYYLLHSGTPSVGKFWSSYYCSFCWLSFKLKMGCPFPLHSYDCLMVTETVLVINGGCSMYIFKISASAAVLFPNFVSGFRLELMFVFIIVNIRLSHLLDFQLL